MVWSHENFIEVFLQKNYDEQQWKAELIKHDKFTKYKIPHDIPCYL